MAKLRDDHKERVETTIERLAAQAPPLNEDTRRRLAGLVATGKVKRR